MLMVQIRGMEKVNPAHKHLRVKCLDETAVLEYLCLLMVLLRGTDKVVEEKVLVEEAVRELVEAAVELVEAAVEEAAEGQVMEAAE